MAHTKVLHLRLLTAFSFGLISALIVPPLFPLLKLTFFAPFLVICYYKKPLSTSILLSLFCGFLMDSFSSNNHLGLYALNYCITSSILFFQKQHFFEDSLTTIPIMTFFFALLSTIFQVILNQVFETPITLSGKWIFTDLIVMPFFDSLYGFLLFTLPSIFLPRKKRREYFLDAD